MAEEWSWARKMVQPYLEAFAGLPMSGSETLSVLRELGVGYRTADFYSDWRGILGLMRYEGPVKGLLPESFIPKSWIQEIERERQQFGANYRYEFDVTFKDIETGEEGFAQWSYSSDIYIPKGMVETEFLTEVPWEVSKPGLEILDVELRGAWHQMGTPW